MVDEDIITSFRSNEQKEKVSEKEKEP